MKGKDLFSKYINLRDDYARDLMTIFLNIGESIYPLLEKAEREGKKLSINEADLPDMWDSFTIDAVTLE